VWQFEQCYMQVDGHVKTNEWFSSVFRNVTLSVIIFLFNFVMQD